MPKAFGTFLPVILFALLLAGCGGKNSGGSAAAHSTPKIESPTGTPLYVSNSTQNGHPAGNDITGDGSITHPFATITAALSLAAQYGPGGGYKILVNTGTYNAEANKRLILQGNYKTWISIEPWSGVDGDVTVADTNSNAGSVSVRNFSISNIQLKGITISASSTGASGFHFFPTASAVKANGLHFVDCTFVGPTRATSNYTAILLDNSGSADGSVSDLAFINCTFSTTGTAAAAPSVFGAVPFKNLATNQPFVNVGFYGCTTPSLSGWGDFSTGATGIQTFTCLNCKWSIAGTHAFLLGLDASGTGTTPGCSDILIAGSTFETNSAKGQALLIGENCSGAVVDTCTISGALHGLVVRGATGTSVKNCTISNTNAVGLDAIYAEASKNTSLELNTVSISGQSQACYCLRESYDSSSNVGDGGLSVGANTFTADGSNENIMSWDLASKITSGGTENNNKYALRNSAQWGSFRGNSIGSFASLRADWAASTVATDYKDSDSSSSVVP